MRRFRVWSNYWKKYAAEAELHIDSSIDAIFEDDDGIPHHENTDMIIEQYTGFKDKNDKEICEGDIIIDFDEFISVVNGNCAIISEKTCHEKHFDEDDYSLERRTRPLIQVVNDYGYYPEKKETQIEVIGNIHENRDLLEEKE